MSLKLISSFLFIFINFFTLSAQLEADVLKSLDQSKEEYIDIAQSIWNFAELGYQERESVHLLQKTLANAGFEVTSKVADIPTAFIATYGSGEPIIGILAEFDALPGISQTANPFREKHDSGENGHACGHHLFGTASIAAAITVKEWLQKSGNQGTIRLYGTPAEEGGAGKVYMVRAGLFDDVNAVLHWHPSDHNSADAASSLANKSAKFRFYGVASHAAIAPENGRSALDGVEAMNYMVNLMREHVSSDSRIHYVITSGGKAPNVVPEFAEVFYYARHPQMDVARDNFERIVKAAEAAAMGTGTRMEYEVIHGSFNLMPNEVLGRLVHKNLEESSGFSYTEEELAFAEKIKETLPKRMQQDFTSTTEVKPFNIIEKGAGGSTDVGDVSWVVPTAGLRTATWVPGTTAHTWQAVAAGGMSIGHKGMMLAAKTITKSAIDLFEDPSIIERAQQELNQRTGENFIYQALLGDREPPLNYRD